METISKSYLSLSKIGSTALGALHGLWASQKKKGTEKSFNIIMCPSHVTKKWVREIGETLPDTYAMVVSNITDLNRLYAMYERGDKSVYAVFSKERARDGYMRGPAVRWNRRRRAFLCPDCDAVIEMDINEDGISYTVPADQFFFLKENKLNHKCLHCGAPLWSAVNPSKRTEWVKIGEYGWVHRYGAAAHLKRTKNEKVIDQLMKIAEDPDGYYPIRGAQRRYPLSTYIKKKLRGKINGFLCDELHEYNNASGQGDAMAELYGTAKLFVGMTATLINGYSSGIFHLLYRIVPGLMLKDDKSYPFIKVTVNEEYPRVLFARRMKKDKAKYFGPYTSAGAVKDVIELVRKLYKVRSCNRVLPRDCGKDRPCLYHHMKQCSAPCQGYVSSEEYKKNIAELLKFLNGDFKDTIDMLTDKMMAASEEMRFEDAMEYRDLIRSIQKIGERQKITGYGEEDKDIIAVAMDESLDLREQDAVVQVFFVRGGKLIGREHFYLRVARGDTKAQVLSSFMKQFYAGTPFIPREIMLQKEIEDAKIIEEWLTDRRKQRVYIRVPKKGTKEKLVELAEENAKMVLDKDRERIKREEGRTIGAVHEVEEWLGLSGIRRMEAYDISNISGFESVGSMVVYEKGKPKRSDYRKFKIKWVQGPNDYASMEEVLTRRFTHEGKDEFDSFSIMPDLILMDGGRGQVNIALKVLEILGIEIPVCGMVKDDHHRTRGLYYNNLEIPIDTDSEGFRLITRIQDEAHRFAIEFHRSLRSKEQVHSLLDDIPGIGETRRKALMRKFKSIENIRDASLEELAETESMNAGSAQKVYEFFHGASVPTS